MLDWVSFASYSGKFVNMKDESNRICAAAERAFQREGIVSKEYSAKNVMLSSRQMTQSGLPDEVKSSKLMDRIINDEEDVIYRVGDVVFCDGKYGEIKLLLEFENERWADVLCWEHIDTDSISCMDFAEINGSKIDSMVKFDELSVPLVTGLDEENIWFMTKLPSNITWINEHLTDY